MTSRVVALAARLLAREWRSGELGVLLLALVVAVAALTGVGFLVDRIERSVAMRANEVLAADLRIEAQSSPANEYELEARRRGLATARSTTILSVVYAAERSQLANVRAVSSAYPLRGRVGVGREAFGTVTESVGAPAAGEAWPDSKLLAALGLQIGDTLDLGATRLTVTRVLLNRPDQGGAFGDLAPSMLVALDDLPATRLLQPGSRAGHALLIAGEPPEVATYETWLAARKQPGERLRDVREASPQIQSAIDRAGRFLGLASLVAVLLCAVAVAMAARRYVQRHLDAVALMKTLGATRNCTLAVSLLQLGAIGIAAVVLGAAVGFGAQEWLLRLLRGLLQADLPAAGWGPLALGFLTAITLLAGFALPPLLQLARVPAMRVLRRDVGAPAPVLWLAFAPAVAAIVFLVYWVLRDLRLFAGFVAGLALYLALLAACGYVLVQLVARLRSGVGVSWRYGLANLARRRADSIVQLVAFGMGIMVLLLLAVVRDDLLADWRRSLPTDLPNYFFINIPKEDRATFMTELAAQGARTSRALPMIRARLIAINDRPAGDVRSKDPRGEGFARRDQNITWQADLGSDNTLVEGRWWSAADRGRALVSVSTEYRDGLGLKLGDRMRFDVAGEEIEATVASVRKIKWDSFQPNFFLVFPPGLLDDVAGTWMTSAYFPGDTARRVTGVVRKFPSVSVFDLGEILKQVRSVVDQAAFAVQSVFVFTLFAGLVVLLAAVQATRDERRYEGAMLRTLGAPRAVVTRGIVTEFAVLGTLAGTLAAAGASFAGWWLASRLLEVRYDPDPRVWLVGIIGGGVLVATSGWLATRGVLRQPPAATLRAP